MSPGGICAVTLGFLTESRWDSKYITKRVESFPEGRNSQHQADLYIVDITLYRDAIGITSHAIEIHDRTRLLEAMIDLEAIVLHTVWFSP